MAGDPRPPRSTRSVRALEPADPARRSAPVRRATRGIGGPRPPTRDRCSPSASPLAARADRRSPSPTRLARVDRTRRRARPAWAGPTRCSADGARRRGRQLVEYSTPLWYAQHVEGRGPDVTIIDDRTRLDEDLGDVTDVIDANLPSAARLRHPRSTRARSRLARTSATCSSSLDGDDAHRPDPRRARREPSDGGRAGPDSTPPREPAAPARVARLSYFFPAHNEEANLAGLVEEALATLPDPRRHVRDHRRQRRLARPDRRPSPTSWPRAIPASSGPSTTRRTSATAPRCGPASGPPATSSSPSPTATASSRSPTSAG